MEPGKLVVVYGPMFASKTTELLKRIRQAVEKGWQVQVFRPLTDTRHREPTLRNHDGEEYPAVLVESGRSIRVVLEASTRLIAVDEVNMFPEGIVEALLQVRARGVDVVVAGLNLDWRAEPFEPVPALIAEADECVSLTADCEQCGKPAHFSQRVVQSAELIVPGGADMYEPRCGRCFVHPDPDSPQGRQLCGG